MDRSLPAATAPVVLTYHDIDTGSPSRYAVSPAAFDAQMAALEKAGYRSMTTEEFVTYLKGGPAPPRSVLITFDDGPRGLWVNADRILARHHLHGTVFLITSRVDDRPYYLSWREIGRMAHSGRWDFQAHTHDLHHRAQTTMRRAPRLRSLQPPVAAGSAPPGEPLGVPGASDRRCQEEPPRVRKPRSAEAPAVRLSLQRGHGARQSATGADAAGTADPVLRGHDVQQVPQPAAPARRRQPPCAADRTVQRLELVRSTTTGELLSKLSQWTQIPPVATDPLTRPALWTRDNGTLRRGVDDFTGHRPFPGKDQRYASAEYRALGSVDWTDYRVDATVTGFGDGTNQASVAVRNRSKDEVVVSVSQGTATLEHGGRKAVVRKLAPRRSHTLSVTVRGATTTALVDGSTELGWVAKGIPATQLTGGLGIRVGSNRPGAPPPAFGALHVSPLPPKTPAPSGNRQALADSAPSAPTAYWESRSGVRAPLEIEDGVITPVGRVALSGYGAYEPARTREWTGYTVSGTISKLHDPRVKGAIQVRVGSWRGICAQVSHSRLEVLAGNADSRRLVGTRPLRAADSHDVSVTATARSTVIRVDGTVRMTLPAAGETGGVAYAAYRDTTRSSWPPLTHLKVVPVAE